MLLGIAAKGKGRRIWRRNVFRMVHRVEMGTIEGGAVGEESALAAKQGGCTRQTRCMQRRHAAADRDGSGHGGQEGRTLVERSKRAGERKPKKGCVLPM